ncbi:MAG: phosphatidate cytidylyltransferase [bacterium]|nr:phosphatidate cytidylyltransferase [bacterium]
MSSFLKRVISTLVVAPVLIIILLYTDPAVFKGLVWGVSLLAVAEFYRMIFPPEQKRKKRFGLFLAGLYGLLLLSSSSESRQIFLVPSMAVLAFAFVLLESNKGDGSLKEAVHELSFYFLGTFYLAGFTLFLAFVRELPEGLFWIFSLLLGTWINDSFSYFFGKLFGRHKMASRISPGKTVEGFFGGFVGAGVAIALMQFLFHEPLTLVQSILLVVLISVIGPIGDLAESLVKRSCDVKDSGQLLPGHGGMWDRIDALIFNAPFVYWFALWVQ